MRLNSIMRLAAKVSSGSDSIFAKTLIRATAKSRLSSQPQFTPQQPVSTPQWSGGTSYHPVRTAQTSMAGYGVYTPNHMALSLQSLPPPLVSESDIDVPPYDPIAIDFGLEESIDISPDEHSPMVFCPGETPAVVTTVSDVSESEPDDELATEKAEALAAEIASGNSIAEVAEDHDELTDREEVITELEAGGYEVSETEEGGVRTTEITHPESDEAITETVRPSGDETEVVTIETTGGESDQPTVVIDDEGGRTELDPSQGTERESIDDIAREFSKGQEIAAIASELGILEEQLIAQLLAAGYNVIDIPNYDQEGNEDGRYRAIRGYGDDGEIIASYDDRGTAVSNYHPRGAENNGNGHHSYFVDSQGNIKETYSTRPEGPYVDGGLDITITVDEEGVTTRRITDNGKTTKEVSHNDRTVITDNDGNVTLRDDETGEEIVIENGEVSGNVYDDIDQSMLEVIQTTDLSGKDGEILGLFIDAWINRDSWLFDDDDDVKSRADELEEVYSASENEVEEVVKDYGDSSREAQEAILARDIAYAAWEEANYAALMRAAALVFYAVDPGFEEAMRSSMAQINELLHPHGKGWDQPNPHLSPEEAKERLEKMERGLELAREAKEQFQEAERFLGEANLAFENSDHKPSIGEIASNNSVEHAIVSELFSGFELHSARGADLISDFRLANLRLIREDVEKNPNAYDEIEIEAIDEDIKKAENGKNETEKNLERAEAQHDVNVAYRETVEQLTQIADEYIEDYVDEDGTFYIYDGFFGQHSGEYKGYSFNSSRSAADGGIWIDVYYENATKTVNVAPSPGALDSWWEANRNADLIRQWHESINALQVAKGAAENIYEEDSVTFVSELGGNVAKLKEEKEEQERVFGQPSTEMPVGAPPEQGFIEIGGKIQVPKPVAERYEQVGLEALGEFDLPARILVDDSTNPLGHSEWRWLERAELARIYLELEEAENSLAAAEQSVLQHAQQAVLRPRLPGESDEEYRRAMYDSLEGEYQQRTLDDFYQARFQEFLDDPTFNAEYEQLGEGELGGWMRQSLGVSGQRIENLDKILEQIRDHGGETPEARSIPLFHVGMDGSTATIALVAVKGNNGEVRYFDATGRNFTDLDDFSKHNRQLVGNGRLVAPANLEMAADRDGAIPLEVADVRAPDLTLDNAVNYTTMAATGASFIPITAPVAVPLAVAGGIYIGARSAYNQWHHVGHGGNWYDTESWLNYGSIVSAALPVASGSLRFAGMAGHGVNVTTAARTSIGAVNIFSQNPVYRNAVTILGKDERLFNMARGLDIASLVVDVPQTYYFAGHVYRNHHQMSDREFTEAMANLAIGVFGTGMSIKGLQLSNLGEEGATGERADDANHAFRSDVRTDTPVALSAAYHPEGRRYPERPSQLPEAFRRPQMPRVLPGLVSDSPLSLTGTAHPKSSEAPTEVFNKRKVDTSIHEYRPEVLRARMPWAAEEAYTPTPNHEELTVVFRGDSRPPDVIFANGFREEGQPDPYGAISTSVSARNAKGFAKDAYEGKAKSGWLYTIVNNVSDEAIVSSLPVEDRFLIGMDHYEIRFNGQIPSENILSARQVDGNDRLVGPPVYNPNFKDKTRLPDGARNRGELPFRDKLTEHVRSKGGISFAEFMDYSLYGLDGEGGYYSSGVVKIGDVSDSDFITAPERSKFFGYTVARSLVDMHEAMGRPQRFDVVEMGAGNGTMAHDILVKLQADHSSLYDSINYTIVERSQALIERQQERLAGQKGVRWIHASADALPLRNIRGVFLSNELPDAFPVHRVVYRSGGLKEIYVTLNERGRFVEEVREPSPALAEIIPKMEGVLKAMPAHDGVELTINARSINWMKRISDALEEGYVLTIDYGEPAATQKEPYVYYKNPGPIEKAYESLGEIDITSHVDNLVISQIGSEFGLETAASLGAGTFDTQHVFLERHGIREELANAKNAQEFADGQRLLGHEYKGFFALLQEKGIRPQVEGVEADVSVETGRAVTTEYGGASDTPPRRAETRASEGQVEQSSEKQRASQGGDEALLWRFFQPTLDAIRQGDDQGSFNPFVWLSNKKTEKQPPSSNSQVTGEQGEISPKPVVLNEEIVVPRFEILDTTLDKLIGPEDYKFVYRGDSRSLEEIYRVGGFKKEGQLYPRGVIYTSLSLEAARNYAKLEAGLDEAWVFVIADRNIDDSILLTDTPETPLISADPRLSIPFKEDIPLESIVAARKVDRKGNWVGPVLLSPFAAEIGVRDTLQPHAPQPHGAGNVDKPDVLSDTTQRSSEEQTSLLPEEHGSRQHRWEPPQSLSAALHLEGTPYPERPSQLPEAFRSPEQKLSLPELTSDSPLSLTGTAHANVSEALPHVFRRIIENPPEGHARLYRLEDLEALNRASSNGELPPGYYVHAVRSADPARDGAAFTLYGGTVPSSGRVDADGYLRWPSSGRGERASLSVVQADGDRQIVQLRDQSGRELARSVNANGDVSVIVTDLSQTNLRSQLRGEGGLPIAEHVGNGQWAVSTSPKMPEQKSQAKPQEATENGATPSKPLRAQESQKPTVHSATGDTTSIVGQLPDLSESQLRDISPSELAQADSKLFGQLTPDKLSAFTDAQWNILTKSQLDQIDTSLLQQYATQRALKEADRKGTLTKLLVGSEGPIFQLHGVDRRGFDELKRQSSSGFVFFGARRTTRITESSDGTKSTASFFIDSSLLRNVGFLDPKAEALLPHEPKKVEIRVHWKNASSPDVYRTPMEMTRTALVVAVSIAGGMALMLPELIPVVSQTTSQVVNVSSYLLRGTSFIIRSRWPVHTASDTNLGRNLRLLEIATTSAHFTATGQKIVDGDSPITNGMIETAYALYTSVTIWEAVTGKAFTGKKIADIWRGLTGREWKAKPDDLGLQLYFWASATPLVANGFVLSGAGGMWAGTAATSVFVGGVLFSLGSLVLYRDAYVGSLVARHLANKIPNKFVALNADVREMNGSEFVNVIKPPWWRFPSTADRNFALYIGGGLLAFGVSAAASLAVESRGKAASDTDESGDDELEGDSSPSPSKEPHPIPAPSVKPGPMPSPPMEPDPLPSPPAEPHPIPTPSVRPGPVPSPPTERGPTPSPTLLPLSSPDQAESSSERFEQRYADSSNESVVSVSRRTNPLLENQGYDWVVADSWESLGSIAIKQGHDITELVKLNLSHIDDPGTLKAGDRIYLPKKEFA